MAKAERKPVKMERAKTWNEVVEDTYRFQCSGWRDAEEYFSLISEQPERWAESNFVKKLPIKGTSNWHYFSAKRECLEKDLNKVKVYLY